MLGLFDVGHRHHVGVADGELVQARAFVHLAGRGPLAAEAGGQIDEPIHTQLVRNEGEVEQLGLGDDVPRGSVSRASVYRVLQRLRSG